ncbi:hypothetical protein MTO96_015824 [Rhipicephalus appendiculatus]
MLEQLSRQATKGSTAPSVVWLRLSGLRHVVDRYTEESYQASHALRLIREFVDKAKNTLKKAYVGDENEPPQKAEPAAPPPGEAAAPAATKDGGSWNLATPWDHEAHVAFVLIGFVLLLLALALFGISVGLWFMDPGRDSIIYRMTTQRMKRD